jgi:hypothetical protein
VAKSDERDNAHWICEGEEPGCLCNLCNRERVRMHKNDPMVLQIQIDADFQIAMKASINASLLEQELDGDFQIAMEASINASRLGQEQRDEDEELRIALELSLFE